MKLRKKILNLQFECAKCSGLEMNLISDQIRNSHVRVAYCLNLSGFGEARNGIYSACLERHGQSQMIQIGVVLSVTVLVSGGTSGKNRAKIAEQDKIDMRVAVGWGNMCGQK